jgi:ABC-type uncharacterized transport system permease subunit
VRIGWLAQTALLVVQAARADGFPWDTWAGSLNLFVWLVVGAYLIWGCRPRFRLLGLVVMPLAALLLAISYAAGGVDASGESGYSTLFLVLHVGLVLAGFAGFTLAAALAALYLWQERQLKHRSSTVLRFRAPSLVTLESLAARTIAFALPVLTLGMAAGFARIRHGSDLDPLIVLTVITWAVYGVFLALRFGAHWRGRRAAYLTLAGFALVVALQLSLQMGHFA